MIIARAPFIRQTSATVNILQDAVHRKLEDFGSVGGNPCDRYARRSMKEDRSEKKKNSRGLIRSRLKSVNIDTTEEEIENILTECFNSESCCIRWWNYY